MLLHSRLLDFRKLTLDFNASAHSRHCYTQTTLSQLHIKIVSLSRNGQLRNTLATN